MRIVSRPEKKVIIQLREFRRPKSGKGNMKHSASRTITIHDADLISIYGQLLRLLGVDEENPPTHP